jgi:ATP-dependent helicase/nuclease subunit B
LGIYTELRDEVGSPVSLEAFDQKDLEERLLRIATEELQAVHVSLRIS